MNVAVNQIAKDAIKLAIEEFLPEKGKQQTDNLP